MGGQEADREGQRRQKEKAKIIPLTVEVSIHRPVGHIQTIAGLTVGSIDLTASSAIWEYGRRGEEQNKERTKERKGGQKNKEAQRRASRKKRRANKKTGEGQTGKEKSEAKGKQAD